MGKILADKHKNIGQALSYFFPTDESIEEGYADFLMHQGHEETHEKVTQIEFGEVFRQSADYKYGPQSDFYRSRYRIVEKLEKKLSDKETLAYAKAGLLSFMAEKVRKKHLLTYFLYMKINSLVREVYYGYYKEVERSILELEKEKLIEYYETLLERINSRIAQSGTTVDSKNSDAEEFVQNLIKKHMASRGIKIEGEKYGILSFGYFYFYIDVANLDDNEINIQKLAYMSTIINQFVSSLKMMDVEAYRAYKFQTMGLTNEEKDKYDKNIQEYQKCIKK